MPPHPTVFVKKIFEKVGNYNTDYTISSDYDFLITFFSIFLFFVHKQNLDENENWWKKQ